MDPVAEAFINETKYRFRTSMARLYPTPVGSDQYRDVIRTWLIGYYEALLSFNQQYGDKCRREVNSHIQLWRIHFGPVFEANYTPDGSWQWWR